MKTCIHKWIVLLLLSAVGLAASACNTTRGVGQDIEEAGEEIQDATR